jgi:hypothetical protein
MISPLHLHVKEVRNMPKDTNRTFCMVSVVLGLILIGLGVFLLATMFPLDFITIGVIVAGILLLVFGCFRKCLRVSCWMCLLLVLIALFLIITGILAILSCQITIGLILIGLGVLAAILTALCLFFRLEENNTLTITDM